MSAQELLDSNWFSGPAFLWNQELPTKEQISPDIEIGDPEVKGVIVCTSIKTEHSVLQRLEKFSDWSKVVIAIAVIKRCIDHRNEPID